MRITPNQTDQSYEAVIERGVLKKAREHIDLNRKVLVVTDDKVPREYAQTIVAQCAFGVLVCLNSGEASKNFDNFKLLLSTMLDNGFSRKDCVVAVGGGVVGDISAFCASCYMRGVDFYNIPTTLLAQIDSSIGGKTAIDFMGIKNVVGSFYQPKKVLIDVDVLATLDKRQLHAGLVEGIKMGATCSRELFDLIQNSCDLSADLPLIIQKSLEIKKSVVERDVKESGLRKVLNFGHTVGHAVESAKMGALLHGECVGLGMLYCASNTARKEIEQVLEKYNLPTVCDCKESQLLSFLLHDKKTDGENICVVKVDEIGSFRFENMRAIDILKGEKL